MRVAFMPLKVIIGKDNLLLFKAFLRFYRVDLDYDLDYLDYYENEQQPLSYAVYQRSYNIIMFMLPLVKDKNPADKGKFKITAMERAIQFGDLKIAQLICPHIAQDSDIWKKPLINDAVETNNIEPVQLLLLWINIHANTGTRTLQWN